jgi:hypothetical protein
MHMTDLDFPSPLANDADDVVIALKSARSLWDSADCAEAARWLRKAASAAQEAGDDDRALELAKRAGDIEAGPAPSAASTSSSAEPAYTQAIRVAVKRSVRDGDLFVARLLENQPVPSGSHEAFLVLTNPNLDLFDPTAS